MATDRIFSSFFMGGFECSTHVRRDGHRLDLVAGTAHDRWAREDYGRLRELGLLTARDGLRWHLIEGAPGRYDFASARPMVTAMLDSGIQVVWDLLHFGWPEHLDVFSADFPRRYAEFVRAAGAMFREEGVRELFFCPVNEISFLAFAGGQEGFFNPFVRGRGDDLKQQLVRTAIAGVRAMREVHPGARAVHTDPIIHVEARPDRPQDRAAAEHHRDAQFHNWDMLAGRRAPELGGSPDVLDILGVNYFVHNQWFYPGGHRSSISPSSARYQPLSRLLLETWERYRRPMVITETGIEDEARPGWLAYVASESRLAIQAGVDLHGLCIYPIVNHPGWEDDRHCQNGLWDYADGRGRREAYAPLAVELQRQQRIMAQRPWTESEEDAAAVLPTLDAVARAVAEETLTSREG